MSPLLFRINENATLGEVVMANRKHETDDSRDKHPGMGEQAGEGVGGIGGTLAGAAIGSAAGPIGTIIGGIAGAAGGWWAGEKAGRALEDMGDHEPEYRKHYDTTPRSTTTSNLTYDDARLGYSVGHVAGRNPDYKGRSFDEVETDLRRGWKAEGSRNYDDLRPYVRHGYERTSRSD
jgi:hypothetical protein